MLKSSLVFILFLVSCSKDKVPIPVVSPEKPWERFVGHFKVYDTTGYFLYDSDIYHYSVLNQFGIAVDSIFIRNFDNLFDLKFDFAQWQNQTFFDFRFHDSIKDYNNKTWNITIIYDDPSTPEVENNLVNNRMTLYFRKTNIKYWMNESVPYVYENVKHVYVKQP